MLNKLYLKSEKYMSQMLDHDSMALSSTQNSQSLKSGTSGNTNDTPASTTTSVTSKDDMKSAQQVEKREAAGRGSALGKEIGKMFSRGFRLIKTARRLIPPRATLTSARWRSIYHTRQRKQKERLSAPFLVIRRTKVSRQGIYYLFTKMIQFSSGLRRRQFQGYMGALPLDERLARLEQY